MFDVLQQNALRGPAFFANAANYLIDVILDVKPSRAIRQAEVGAARTIIGHVDEFLETIGQKETHLSSIDIHPERVQVSEIVAT